MRPALVVALACLAGACARSDRPAILAPPATVTILAATTRGPSETPGELFGGEHGAAVTFAHHVIATPPNRPVGDVIMADRETDAHPDQHFRITATRVPLAEKDMAAYIAAARRKQLAAIVFVHGFNNTYRAGLYRAAQITADLNAIEAPMFFSFASAGSLLNYWTDRGNAEKAAPAFARFIEKASAQAGGQIDVGAHSMGAWMTVLALKDIAGRHRGRSRPIIRGLMLAAPDIDAEEFIAIWPRIRPMAAN
ncbi:MAG: alpha/beta hydrolase, partial [Beijerinckiaceae bacterium]